MFGMELRLPIDAKRAGVAADLDLNKGKEKQPFRSSSAALIMASRTANTKIRCEQTTAFELVKLFQ